MASPDVVVATLLLPIPVLSLVLSFYNAFFLRSRPAKTALLVILAILAALAGGTALSVACSGEPLGVVANVFASLLHATLSAISIYALSPSSQTPAFPVPFLAFFLALAGLLTACELISALIPTRPVLVPAALALVSRGILLVLVAATAIILRHPHAASEADSEKSPPSSGRVSSPTQATWPFPGSLALQGKLACRSTSADPSTLPNLVPSSTPVGTRVNEDAFTMQGCLILLPLVLTVAQLFAVLSASLSVAASMLVDRSINRSDQTLPRVLLASATCTLVWSLAILAVIQILPVDLRPSLPEKPGAIGYGQTALRSGSNKFLRDNPVPRTLKPSLSRRESDSPLDFLSLRDPFASSPPPPPPLPPVGLGLDEVDVGWNGNREIGVQYRFPAPRSIVKGSRRKGRMVRANGKSRLAHQDSSRTLLPVPETRGTADTERDKGFGDEARLAQLLLDSLCEAEDDGGANASTPVPTVTPPQPAHVQPTSRWSTGTTVQSIMSASVSNKSGVSTYTTCASDKVPTSRISMNTIASVLGSRKSSEAKRKSGMTASSSKG